MAGHDIIVIGGSAGSIEALSALLAGLPEDLPAAVCVAVHQSAYAPNRRPEIFARATRLPVVLAEHGMPLRPGTVYLAVPDMHLLVERGATAELGALRLVRGPKENRARPAVDPLFRTAALAFGPRVIGVVLSGALDDGTSGLWSIKDRGGIAVVQDPKDAAVYSMPQRALDEVGADHVCTAQELGPLLARLAREAVGHAGGEGTAHPHIPRAEGDMHPHLNQQPDQTEPGNEERQVKIGALDEQAHRDTERYGMPSRFACPDCGGVLWAASRKGAPLHFRCETGHAYSGASLSEAQADGVEWALWAALRALEDKGELARLRGGLARERGMEEQAKHFDVQLEAAQEHAAAIRALLRMDGSSGIRPSVPEAGDTERTDRGGDKPVARTSSGD